MFRLLKLAIYGAIGYAIYEMIQGWKSHPHGPGVPQQDDLGKALDEGEFRTRLTGPGRGMRVEVEDASGTGGQEIVGRGVV